MSNPTKVAERVTAAELPGVILSLVAEGHHPTIRPRGPHGSQSGQFAVISAQLNAEPHTERSPYGVATRTLAPGETIAVVHTSGRVSYWPLQYSCGSFGRTTRAVTFRVFV